MEHDARGSKPDQGAEPNRLPEPPPEQAADLWVFGYGSLMWNPGFDYAERQVATLRGCHRRLCVLSHVHRGTLERPGLVLGLDRGGACTGVAFRVPAERVAETRAYLTEREQINKVYREAFRPVLLRDGRVVNALAYVVDRAHRQYAGRLHHDEMVAMVRHGVGRSGANPDYVLNTVAELTALGLVDPVLSALAAALRENRDQEGGADCASLTSRAVSASIAS